MHRGAPRFEPQVRVRFGFARFENWTATSLSLVVVVAVVVVKPGAVVAPLLLLLLSSSLWWSMLKVRRESLFIFTSHGMLGKGLRWAS